MPPNTRAIVSVEPRPAATTMLVRPGPEGYCVFMARRNSSSRNLPDHYVFPGGKLDQADYEPALLAKLRGFDQPAEQGPFAVAAIRELFEEAGVLLACNADGTAINLVAQPERLEELLRERTALARGEGAFSAALERLGLYLDGRALVPFSRWVTPLAVAARFDTVFFLVRAPEDQTASEDQTEIYDGEWLTPRAALQRHAAGKLTLIFPTIKHLERLAEHPDSTRSSPTLRASRL